MEGKISYSRATGKESGNHEQKEVVERRKDNGGARDDKGWGFGGGDMFPAWSKRYLGIPVAGTVSCRWSGCVVGQTAERQS